MSKLRAFGKKKKSKKKDVRQSAGFKMFSKIVFLAFPIITFAYIFWYFKSQITSIKLFSILMTLGGLETYEQTVTGILILILVFGVWLIPDD